MPGIDDWLDLMTQTCTVESFIGRDSYGVATYGAAVTYRCRINYKTHLVRVSETEVKAARGMAWLATANTIDVNDRVVFQDGTVPLILVSNGENDENGPLYTRLDFG